MARDFPSGLVVKNPPFNAGDTGSIPGWGIKISHATGQLNPCATTREAMCYNYRACTLWSPCTTTREKPACHNEEPARCSERSRMPQLKPNAAKNK